MKKTKEDILWEKIVKAYETNKIACTLHYLKMYQQNFSGDVRCLSLLADIMIEFCQYDKAKDLLDQAWNLSSENGQFQGSIALRYGNFYKEKGEIDNALEWYQKAVDIDGGQDYIVILGTAQFQLARFDLAAETFQKAIAVDEKTADEAWFNLGSVYFVQENYDKAEECYNNSLKLDSANEAAKMKLADIKELKKLLG